MAGRELLEQCRYDREVVRRLRSRPDCNSILLWTNQTFRQTFVGLNGEIVLGLHGAYFMQPDFDPNSIVAGLNSNAQRLVSKRLREELQHLKNLIESFDERGSGEQIVGDIWEQYGPHCDRKLDMLPQQVTSQEAGHSLRPALDLHPPDRPSGIFAPIYWTEVNTDDLCSYSPSDYWRVSVTGDEKEHIGRLMRKTWFRDEVGVGRDARGLRHKDFEVVEVERIETPLNFHKYACKMATVKQSEYVEVLTEDLDFDNVAGLRKGVNECYLWHGTKEENVEAIIVNGLDFRVAGSGLYGRGVYFAEKSSKSDEYVGESVFETVGKRHNVQHRHICLFSHSY